MRQLIERNTVGFVATVTPEGRPAVSPKGTSIVIDERRVAFGDLRSPGTARNLRANPAVEINYLEVLSRKAVRLSGTARRVSRGTGEFVELLPRFQAWSTLAPRLRGVFVVEVTAAQLILSPAYDIGATEDELRRHWSMHYSA
ncbi:MAG: pyridoxamine 5'-phosphate oxidase family protein [Burkholderiales bacterium]|nr:pyridoxamine 5'-phosphate oxidase family protein [Burkholderiales bacterium]